LIQNNFHNISTATRSFAFRGQQNMLDDCNILPQFLENLIEKDNFICSPTARTKTASRILTHLQMRLRYVAASCFKATLFQGIHFPERLRKHSSQHLMHSLPFPFFCIRKMILLC